MRQHFYNPETHIGKQPVRVLKWNIAHYLEHVHSDFPHEFAALLQRHNLDPCIHYDYSEAAIIERWSSNKLVPFVDEKKRVTIQESFMSLVWCQCYSHMVLFEEQNSKPILSRLHGQNYVIDRRVIRDADRLYRYGVGLVRKFIPWDTANLPNPEDYDPADIYIEKTNAVFSYAMVFILCHEFAHIDRGHLDDYIPAADRPLAEMEADTQAVQTMLRGATDKNKKATYGMGMLLGFCSLLTLQRELESSTHPHLGERIERVLRAQELDDISPLWGIATMSFRLWDDLYNGSEPRIEWPNQAETFKELFYHVLSQVR